MRMRNAEPQARRAEYPGQAHELRIAAFRKRSIKRFTTQARALSNRGDTALRLCDIAEGLHQPLRVPLVKHRFDVGHCVRLVFQPFEKMRPMRYASGCACLVFSFFSDSHANTPLPVQCPPAACACRHRKAGESPVRQPARSTRDNPVPSRSAVPTRFHRTALRLQTRRAQADRFAPECALAPGGHAGCRTTPEKRPHRMRSRNVECRSYCSPKATAPSTEAGGNRIMLDY